MTKNDAKKYKIIAIFNIIAMAIFLFVYAYNYRNTMYYKTHGGEPSEIFGIAVEVIRLINKIGLAVFVLALGKADKKYFAVGLLFLLQAGTFFANTMMPGTENGRLLHYLSIVFLIAANSIFAFTSQKLFDKTDAKMWDRWRKYKKQYLIDVVIVAAFGACSYLPGFGIIGVPAFFIGCAYGLYLNVLLIIYLFKSAESLNKQEA